MKKKDVPQDKGPLENISKEIVYAKNEQGEFEKTLSSGWDVKFGALDNAWSDLNDQTEKKARQLVLAKKKSPIYYFMHKNLMDRKVLAAYVGLSKFTVKRHLKFKNFIKLNDSVLSKYAEVFEISVEELKSLAEN